jgi:dienelactone hydrolase
VQDGRVYLLDYDAKAACDAWGRTIAWFNTYLRVKG